MGRIHVVSVAIAAISISMAVGGAFAQPAQAGASAGQTVIFSVRRRITPSRSETLARYFADMDAQAPDAACSKAQSRQHPPHHQCRDSPRYPTIDLCGPEGSGTLTTGGTIQNGKIVGGQSHTIRAGDVEFIPATVPHGVSGVQGSITWLNIRWDNDWK
jgi:hypothetical protein